MSWVENVHVLRGPAPFDWATDDEQTAPDVAEAWASHDEQDRLEAAGAYDSHLTDTERAIGDFYDRCAAEGRSAGD